MKQHHAIYHRKWYDCRAGKSTLWLSNQRDDCVMHNCCIQSYNVIWHPASTALLNVISYSYIVIFSVSCTTPANVSASR